MQEHANPGTKFVFHNAFRYDPGFWNDMFTEDDKDGWNNVVMDHHYYQAWNHGMNTTKQFCDDYELNAANADNSKYEVWFGEWALATDVCAHWLGGFNDGNTDPQFKCKWVDCPKTYMNMDADKGHGTDFDRTVKEPLGPFGTADPNVVAIKEGKCSTDSDFFNHTEVQTIAKCALKSFDKHLNGTFF